MLNYRLIINILGRLSIINGFFMLLCLIPSFYYQSGDHFAFIYSAGISIAIGYFLHLMSRKNLGTPGKKEGYFVVASGWLFISAIGALPFIFSGAIPTYTDAFFETISGYTTTGASILTEIESLPEGILFWRSMIQWIGGMGIIVLTVAIMPFIGVGASQMFAAEVPGPTPDKLHPRIKETAKRLWLIYLGFTIAETILLKIGGMNVFDALCHSFTTMATGGYSTKNASIAFWDSHYIHYVIAIFMFFAGTNFSLFYFALHRKFGKMFRNQEFKTYFFVTMVATISLTVAIHLGNSFNLEKSFRDSFFQVTSIITTTGFATADYLLWIPFAQILIFMLMFVGGSAGSTGGGIKVLRHLLLVQNTVAEFKRLLHPKAIIPVKYNHEKVSNLAISNTLAFFFLYIFIFIVSTLIMISIGSDFETGMGAVIATLGNIGPGIGDVGPTGNYHEISIFGKWFLSFLMLVGRLELFTVLILFTRAFWRK